MAVAHNQRVHPSYATVKKKNRVGETGGSGNGGLGKKSGVGEEEGKKREVIRNKKGGLKHKQEVIDGWIDGWTDGLQELLISFN